MPQPQAADQAPPRTRTAQRDAMPLQVREARVQPQTFNAERNTVQVMWSNGARVRRYDWWTERYYEEELVVSPDSVDMSRFDAGAVQVLDGHDRYSVVRAILGIADRGWLENGEAMAEIRLSGRDDLAGIVGDIRAGIIRDISCGYSVERYEIVRAQDRTDGINMDLWRATRWTPHEISFVAVPADPSAGTRDLPAQYPCQFTRAEVPATSPQEQHMPQANQPGAAAAIVADDTTRSAPAVASAPAVPAAPAADAAEAARQAEIARGADITELCARHGVPQLAANFIRSGASVDQAARAVLDEVGRRDAAAGGHTNVRGIRTERDEQETRLRGIEEMLLHRCDARSELTDNGRQYRGMSLLELGRDYLERAGINTRGMTRMALATQFLQFRSGGMMGTSDFASLLANVANKRLRQGYTENMPSYTRWARRAPNAPDFKQMSVVNLAGAPDLLQTNEHGEFKYGAMTDGKETYSMLTYGRIVSFTRQALINDDLRGFDRMVGAFGNSAARLENRTVYGILTANANLSDGGALFNATAVTSAGGHANLTSTGTAISIDSLGVGRTLMRLQKGLQGEELNIAPAYLIVPATKEHLAYQFTSSNYVPATAGAVNEFRGGGRTAVEPVVEALLDANSTTAWYLAANTGAVDTVEYCFLDGAEGPVIESEVGFEVDGISYKCREDFAAKAIDFRGLYKNNGA
ncbi:MAG: hypothetical protein RL375_4129 [Pseudomonadota bacterium]